MFQRKGLDGPCVFAQRREFMLPTYNAQKGCVRSMYMLHDKCAHLLQRLHLHIEMPDAVAPHSRKQE